jgi:hypothetical protein
MDDEADSFVKIVFLGENFLMDVLIHETSQQKKGKQRRKSF